MTDLIERLRTERSVYDAELCDEAADKIVELQALLEKEKRAYRTAIRMPFMRSTPTGWEYVEDDEDG